MISFKLTTVGSSEGFIVTKEAKTKMSLQKGEYLFSTDAPGDGMRLTPYNPDFERQMTLAEKIMHEDREILRVRAK